jgi:hypothetical protein
MYAYHESVLQVWLGKSLLKSNPLFSDVTFTMRFSI